MAAALTEAAVWMIPSRRVVLCGLLSRGVRERSSKEAPLRIDTGCIAPVRFNGNPTPREIGITTTEAELKETWPTNAGAQQTLCVDL